MDEAKLHAFMGKMVTDIGGAAMMANVLLGDELGFYRAMADGASVTAEELASRTQCHPRLVREWLNAQAASGYVELDGERFRLPVEHALALAVEDSPVFVAGGVGTLAAMYNDKDKIVAAMRGDGGLSWGDHHPCLFKGVERFFRPGYRSYLVNEWLPHLEGMVQRLQAGAKVADVGCGHGASAILMAQAFPASRFHGFDFHAPSIDTARQRAADAGVADRVQFEVANAKSFAGDNFDLICFFDCLHDLGDPVGAAPGAGCAGPLRARPCRVRTARRVGATRPAAPAGLVSADAAGRAARAHLLQAGIAGRAVVRSCGHRGQSGPVRAQCTPRAGPQRRAAAALGSAAGLPSGSAGLLHGCRRRLPPGHRAPVCRGLPLSDQHDLDSAWHINNNGEVLGTVRTPPPLFNKTVVLWRNGGFIPLGALPGGLKSYARGINNARTIVGVSTVDPPYGWRAVTWTVAPKGGGKPPGGDFSGLRCCPTLEASAEHHADRWKPAPGARCFL